MKFLTTSFGSSLLTLVVLCTVFSQYKLMQTIDEVFEEAANQLEDEFRILYHSDDRSMHPRFKRDGNNQLKKDANSLMLSVQKTSLESQKIHESFKIALKASRMLKNNNTIFSNQTQTLKLRAPPKFCPFSFEISCDDLFLKYRQIDGSCNNPGNSLIGKTSTPFKRLLKASYEDGIEEPKRVGVDGELLPNPREIALKVHDPLDLPAKISHYGVLFGQFIDHDFAQSAATGSGFSPLKCMCNSNSQDCINIPTPDDDMFDDQECMVLTRSGASFDKFDCSVGAREQLNLLTHWLDLSQMYGSDMTQHNQLRSFRDGKLKSSKIRDFSRREFLPKSKPGGCVEEFGDELCFESGDSRTSQNMMLVSIHTIWLREHNRVAKMLKKLNPKWSDENLYQEARRIVIAEYQNTIYAEWLPSIIGQEMTKSNNLEMQDGQYFMGYDSDTNPHLSSEFSTAAFRFGHTLLRSTISKSDRDLKEMANLTLSNIMLRPVEAYSNGGLDSICRGLLVDPGTSFDPHFTDEVQNHLFETSANDVQTRRFSLSAINIMRGRDHGLPSYNEFRKLVGLKIAKNFDELTEVAPLIRKKLRRVYKNVNDVEAFTGGTSEIPMDGALLGPTFANIVARQFRDLKVGDNYYFENGNNETIRFTLPQLNEIRKSTMSRIICDNLDITAIQKNAFLPVAIDNPLLNCTSFQKLSFKDWKDEKLPVRSQQQSFNRFNGFF